MLCFWLITAFVAVVLLGDQFFSEGSFVELPSEQDLPLAFWADIDLPEEEGERGLPIAALERATLDLLDFRLGVA